MFHPIPTPVPSLHVVHEACLPVSASLQVCNIFAYQDRHFLCASVPVHRMHVHVRRLVQAGHKVGLVTQTETAAIKNAEGKGAKTFSRELTAMYTASTMEVRGRPRHWGVTDIKLQ